MTRRAVILARRSELQRVEAAIRGEQVLRQRLGELSRQHQREVAELGKELAEAEATIRRLRLDLALRGYR